MASPEGGYLKYAEHIVEGDEIHWIEDWWVVKNIESCYKGTTYHVMLLEREGKTVVWDKVIAVEHDRKVPCR